MNKKRNTSILCFPSGKNLNKANNNDFNSNCVTVTKNSMSKSFVEQMNYFDSVSVNSGQNVLSARPMPPPYDECTSKFTSNGIVRSVSTYSASNERCMEKSTSKTDSSDDTYSHCSESDPPKLVDEYFKPAVSRYCIRPKTLRPMSPSSKRSTNPISPYGKSYMDSKESPSADSGVRLTPNDIEQRIKKIEVDPQRLLTRELIPGDELKMLRAINNKLTLNEINNQNLINKATTLIDKLRRRLKEKNFEIMHLQNKLKSNTEKLKFKETECQTLEQKLQESCQIISLKSSVLSNTKDALVQTSISLEQDFKTIDYQVLQQKFEEERAKWLEEKTHVIAYHKHLNKKYQTLLEKNNKLEAELLKLQEKLMFEQDYSCNTDNDSDGCDSEKPDPDGQYPMQNSSSSSSNTTRLVKFEESLC